MRRPSGVLRPAAATAWPITWPPNTCPPGCGEESPSKARTVVGEARDSSTVISRRSSSDTRPALITDGSGVSGEDERSEEHTSELQSRGHLVCRLLLEKKKRQTITGGSAR